MATAAKIEADDESGERNAAGRARQQQAMRAMTRRLMAHVKAGGTTDFAAEVMELDARIFSDPERLEAERRALFGKLPLVAGFSCDIPEPGDKLTFDETGVPIVVVRNRQGEVRAYLNACRHRGARLVRACARSALMTCPFHAWTYDLDGRLIGVPGKEAFEGIDQDALDLVRVPVAEFAGLIFVKTHPGDETIDVEGFLGGMADELRQLDLGGAAPVAKRTVEVGANWKFAQDTFFESYHFPALHPTTINTTSRGNSLIHDSWGPHQRVMTAQRFLDAWADLPEEEWGLVPYQGIHLIFPNTIFFSGSVDGMTKSEGTERQIYGAWRIFPGAEPGVSVTQMATYRPVDQSSDAQVRDYEALSDYIMKVIEEEDYSLCRDSQANHAAAPEGRKLLIGRNEIALQAIHRAFDAALAAG